MKFRNRIMSWILSPGAYALWHSFGNPDEWDFQSRNRYGGVSFAWLHHQSGIRIWIGLEYIPPFRTLFCRFVFNGEDDQNNRRACIGLLERHLIYGRAVRCGKKVWRRRKNKAWNDANMSIFKKLTVNEE